MRQALHTAALLLALCTLAACADEETDLGANLMGGETLYNGKSYTMYADTAYSRRDDTLLWLDTHIVVNDYDRYAPQLRTVADYLGRMSLRYSRMEQQRVD